MKVTVEIKDEYIPYLNMISVISGKQIVSVVNDIVTLYMQEVKKQMDEKVKEEIKNNKAKKNV